MGTNSINLFNRKAAYIAAAIVLLVATLIPALAFAATVTERSIALSSSAANATGVTYDINFKPGTNNTGAVIVDFCTTPTIGAACTTPAGFSVPTTPTTTSAHTVSRVDSNTVKIVLNAPVGTSGTVAAPVSGITNPSATGPFYARIVTYTDDTASAQYTSATDIGTTEEYLDTGTVAMSITNSIGVSGAVLESLIFCVSGAAITDDCVGAQTSPNIVLGTNGVLDTELSEGTIHSQITTNAAKGAVVRLKSNTVECGGLMLAGATGEEACGIKPKIAAGAIADGAAEFGLKLANITAAEGAVEAEGSYNTSTYYLGFDAQNELTSGVTSTYGDPVLNTNDLPVLNGKADFTFGANISNLTPAGTYSATLNLIATGKF